MSPFYRAGKKLVRSLPAWLVRFRPFVLYEIRLAGPTPASCATGVSPVSSAMREGTSALAARQWHTNSKNALACDIRWLAGAAEASALGPLASQECLETFDGAKRRAAAAWHGGRPIACAWIAAESFDERELGLRFELAPDELWLFAAVVAPEHRGQGVYRQLLEFVICRASRQRRGPAAVRRHRRQRTLPPRPRPPPGAVEVGRITALRTLGVTFCRRAGRIRRLPRRAGDVRGAVRLAVSQPVEEKLA